MIKLFKLTSGEEVISESTIQDNGTYLLSNPVIFVQYPNETTGQVQTVMIPWMRLSDDNKFILYPTSMVLDPCNPVQEIVDLYTSRFGGIVLASALPARLKAE